MRSPVATSEGTTDGARDTGITFGTPEYMSPEQAMSAGTTLGYCFGVAWLLLKLGYYVAGVVVLRKPEAQAFLAAK